MKAAMFDLNGTLDFQTEDYIYKTVGKTLSELGLEADERFADEFWYGSNRDKIIKDKLGVEPMAFWEVFWKYDPPEERAKHTGVYDDVSALIKLKEKGIKLGLVTGAIIEVASAELSKIKSKFKDLEFDSIVSNNPKAGIRQKPYPDSLLICLRELGVKNGDAIYVGNSREDVEAAIAAKVKPVVILREPIRRMNYDASVKLIYSLHEVESII